MYSTNNNTETRIEKEGFAPVVTRRGLYSIPDG